MYNVMIPHMYLLINDYHDKVMCLFFYMENRTNEGILWALAYEKWYDADVNCIFTLICDNMRNFDYPRYLKDKGFRHTFEQVALDIKSVSES